jgi:hypothetical protein
MRTSEWQDPPRRPRPAPAQVGVGGIPRWTAGRSGGPSQAPDDALQLMIGAVPSMMVTNARGLRSR